MSIDERVIQEAASHPYPLIFASLSGAHLYGFASEDSDWDLRGAHLLPLDEVVSLKETRETVEVSYQRSDFEMDLVTHDIKKFIRLMLKRNGYVLEQLLSPILVFTTPAHAALKELAEGCLTRYHAHHYLGFSANQWQLYRKQAQPRVKPLLYVYRTLLTGIFLMEHGQLEANLIRLNEYFQLPFLANLIRSKVEGGEQQILDDGEFQFHEGQFQALTRRLEKAQAQTSLPAEGSAFDELNHLLIQLRTQPELLMGDSPGQQRPPFLGSPISA